MWDIADYRLPRGVPVRKVRFRSLLTLQDRPERPPGPGGGGGRSFRGAFTPPPPAIIIQCAADTRELDDLLLLRAEWPLCRHSSEMMRSEYTELGAPQRITRHFAQFMAVQGTTLRGSWLTETSEKCLILRGYPLRSSGAARIKVQNTLYLELGE